MTPVASLPGAEALRASLGYHFAPTDVAGVFARHAAVQFDPLAPLGCSHDLVFAARVPDYRVGDWRRHVYQDRVGYDGWDKQASLVETAGQPARRIHHRWNAPRWHDGVLAAWPEETDEVLAQLRERGPLEALEVEVGGRDGGRIGDWEGSWYGPRLAKRILRALWHTGRVATHHRRHGRHVYDLIERVIPEAVLAAPTPDEDAAVRSLVLDRHRSAGVLRPTAPAEVWSLQVPAAARHHAISELVDAGELVPIDVAGVRHHAVPGWLAARDAAGGAPGARFVAPLDPLLWDRPGVRRAFGFDYLWEVYKPEAERRWGWYVLPVAWRDRFVARIDAALEERPDGEPVWRVRRWWWEEGAEDALGGVPGGHAAFLADLEAAASAFARYLGVRRLVARGGVPREVAAALRAGASAPAPVEPAP